MSGTGRAGGRRHGVPPVVATAVLATVAVAGAATVLGACGSTRDAASDELTTVAEGTLTVAASVPSPGFWDGDEPASIDGGFEWALAGVLADRFGLELVVVDVTFERIAAGDLGGADLALAQIEVTSERAGVVDFSIPYYDVDMGVLVRDGAEVRDLAGARELAWVAVASSREEDFVRDTIAPGDAVRVVPHELEAAATVALGHVDAALIDLPSALVIAADQPALAVTARFHGGGQYAAALPPGSPNVQLVDAAIRAFERDGTLDQLEREWLVPAFDRSPGDITVIRTR